LAGDCNGLCRTPEYVGVVGLTTFQWLGRAGLFLENHFALGIGELAFIAAAVVFA